VLPTELVHARRQKDRLHGAPLGERRDRAIAIAEELVGVAEAHVGRTREELEAAWRAVETSPRDVKLRDGLVALLDDVLDLDTRADVDPVALRADVFGRAAARRREGSFDRAAILAEVASERSMTSEAIEAGLFADLRGAQVLRAPSHGPLVPGGAHALVDRYDLAQVQSVLLRATRIDVVLHAPSPLALRNLLRKLRFHRLLFTATREGERTTLRIDGPSALFEATTRYGLALALAVPSLLACGPERLEADLRWGKERLPLRYVLEAPSPLLGAPRAPENAGLTDEASALLEKLRARSGRFEAMVADTLLDVPGLGLVVPDLTLRSEDGRRVHVEVLGYWSRDAVWRRVELAERGLREPVIFCASERLRVSEAVLPEATGAALYVFKGVISASVVLERAERLLAERRVAEARPPDDEAAPSAPPPARGARRGRVGP
jgi:predicted nuclease of restriction endonuclease-like RecB superfamily